MSKVGSPSLGGSFVQSYAFQTFHPFTAPTSPADELTNLVPALRTLNVPAPCGLTCGWLPGETTRLTLAQTIVHLNDFHRWRREQIADWLETLSLDLTLQATSKGD